MLVENDSTAHVQARMASDNGFFVTLSSRSSRDGGSQVSVAVNDAEHTVLRELLKYALPRLFGWDVALGC
jgi:hypothetical protein